MGPEAARRRGWESAARESEGTREGEKARSGVRGSEASEERARILTNRHKSLFLLPLRRASTRGDAYEPNQALSFGMTVRWRAKSTNTRVSSCARRMAYVAFRVAGTLSLIEVRKSYAMKYLGSYAFSRKY